MSRLPRQAPLRDGKERPMKSKAILVYITASTRKEADKIAQALVEKRLAACVTIIPEVSSRYWWKGRMEYDRELMLVAKTWQSRFKSLEKTVRAMHSYDVPEILAIPVVAGSADYLSWMKDAVQ